MYNAGVAIPISADIFQYKLILMSGLTQRFAKCRMERIWHYSLLESIYLLGFFIDHRGSAGRPTGTLSSLVFS